MKHCIPPAGNKPTRLSTGTSKLMRGAKLTLILLAMTIQVSARAFSQQITLSVKEAPLEQVLKKINQQTGFLFLYSAEQIKKARPVTLSVKNASLEDVLNRCFKNQPFTYEISKQTILIKSPAPPQEAARQAARPITGTVSDEDGQPLEGVTVSVKENSKIATTTVANGSFSLTVPDDSKVLVFSFVGYASQEVRIGDLSRFNIRLQPQAGELDQVVVAYGTSKNKALTNSVVQIKSQQIEQRSLTNMSSALAGAAPGIQTTSGSGQPGEGPAIRIRGFGSITGGMAPLFILDGAPYEGVLSNINPDDIESISVLKDASAAALYGSRGANGVIIITTKKGAKNRNSVNVKVLQGITSRSLSNYEKVDAYEYYPLMWETRRNSLLDDGETLEDANQEASDGIIDNLVYNPFNVADNEIVLTDGTINPNAKLIYDDLNWKKPLQRTGIRSDYNLSMSGGNDKSDYYVSLSYLKDQGFSLGTDFDRVTARAKLNSQPRKWLKLGLNLGGNTSQLNDAIESSGINENPFYVDLIMGPIYPIYQHDATTGDILLDDNGNKIYDNGDYRPIFTGRNILQETLLNENFIRRNALNARTNATITFLKDFTFTTNLGLDINNYWYLVFDNPEIGDSRGAGRSYRTNTLSKYVNINQLLQYDKKLGEHSVNVLLGHESYQYQYNYMRGQAENMIVDGSTELDNFTNILSLNSYENNYRTEGYFSRVEYNYGDKYYLTGSFRRDGSSKFHPDYRWGNFFSVGAGWLISSESFFDASFVNLLKLRASYGQVGSDDLSGYYLYQSFYDIGYNNGTEAGLAQNTYAGNDALQWESNNSFDVALEFSLLKNRLGGTLEFFHRDSKALLFDVPQPVSSGIETQNQNIGSMYNEGIEVTLNGTPVKTKKFRWLVDFNITTFKNKITKLPYEEQINDTKKFMVGVSRYEFYLRKRYGVDPDTGDELFWAKDATAANTFVNGKGDTVTTAGSNADYHYAGSAIPDFYGSIQNTFTYKNFSLGILLMYQIGGKVFDNDYKSLMYRGTYGRALHKDALRRWQQPGDITDVPRRTIGTSSYDSDYWLVDASYLNFRTATLTYNLSKKFTSRVGINNARVYLSGENLFILARRKGLDPTQTYSGSPSYTYAPTRMVNLGINVSL